MFNVKYLGMTLVGQPKGEDMASAAIRRIVTTVSHRSSSDSNSTSTYLRVDANNSYKYIQYIGVLD